MYQALQRFSVFSIQGLPKDAYVISYDFCYIQDWKVAMAVESYCEKFCYEHRQNQFVEEISLLCLKGTVLDQQTTESTALLFLENMMQRNFDLTEVTIGSTCRLRIMKITATHITSCK